MKIKFFLLIGILTMFFTRSIGQNFGIGITVPKAGLHIVNDNGLIASGTVGGGTDLQESGFGSKLIWYPKKAAFRAGSADATGWNDSLIGYYSLALGRFPIASGYGSLAIGESNQSLANYAWSIGQQNISRQQFAGALGSANNVNMPGAMGIGNNNNIFLDAIWNPNANNTFAMGNSNIASADSSFIIGNNSGVTPVFYPAKKSFVIGNSSQAASSNNFSIGNSTTTEGPNSFAYGNNAYSFGINSFAIGNFPYSAGTRSLAIGNYVTASGIYSIALGTEVSSGGDYSMALGHFSKTTNSDAISIGSLSEASGLAAIAIGYNNLASGDMGIAIGYKTTASGLQSTAMGYLSSTQGYSRSFVINGSSNASNNNITGNTADNQMMMNFNDYIFWCNTPGKIVRFSSNGDICASGAITANSVSCFSDQRFKKNISPLTASLEKINRLNGYHYFWIDSLQNRSIQTGVIAQELNEILPELVSKDDKGFLSVNYIGIIPHLIESVKTLKKENDEIREDILKMKKQLELLLNSATKAAQ